MSVHVESISRMSLLFAVEKALAKLRDPNDRAAVWAYAQEVDRVAAGAWNYEGCRCPASAVGIDRLRDDAQAFAAEFDYWLEASPEEPVVFEIVSPATNQQQGPTSPKP